MQYDTMSTRRLKAVRDALQAERDEIVERTSLLVGWLDTRLGRIEEVMKGRDKSAKDNNRESGKRVSGQRSVRTGARRRKTRSKRDSE